MAGKSKSGSSGTWDLTRVYNADLAKSTAEANVFIRLGTDKDGENKGKIVGSKKPDKYTQWCLRYTNTAVMKGLGEPGSLETKAGPQAAHDFYNLKLRHMGFDTAKGPRLRGDVAVMRHGTYGHACIWTGEKWISDAEQKDVWPYDGSGTIEYYRYQGPILIDGKKTLDGLPLKSEQDGDSSSVHGAIDTLLKIVDTTKQKLVSTVVDTVELQALTGAQKADSANADGTGGGDPTKTGSLPTGKTSEPQEKVNAPKTQPTVPAAPNTDGTERALKKTLELERRFMSKEERALTKQEARHHEAKADATKTVERKISQANGDVLGEVAGKIKTLGAASKADQIKTAGSRTVRAAKSAFRQGMAFGWPAGPIVGAAAAVATLAAGKVMISRIASLNFEDGGPVPGPRAGMPVEKKRPGSGGVSRNILPVVNIEVEGEASPQAVKGMQSALDEEMEIFARNLELSRQR